MTAKKTTDVLPEGCTWVLYLNEWPINIIPPAQHHKEAASIFDTPLDCLEIFNNAFASEGVASLCVQSTKVGREPPRGKQEMIVQQWINKGLPAMAFIRNRKTPVKNYIANALTESGGGVFQVIDESDAGNYPLARAEDMYEYTTALYKPLDAKKGWEKELEPQIRHMTEQATMGEGATPTDWRGTPQPTPPPIQPKDTPEVFEQPDGSFVDANGNPVIINT